MASSRLSRKVMRGGDFKTKAAQFTRIGKQNLLSAENF